MALGSLSFVLCMSVLLMSCDAQATKVASPVCFIRTLADAAASQGDLCNPDLLKDNFNPRVKQVAGSDVHNAIGLYMKGNCVYGALLFYAEWCPFSRTTRQMFDQLSIMFPDVCHLAVESSGLWPSELSEHGVRSLPTLLLHNKTMRFQFRGPRNVETLSQFYEAKTGLMHIPWTLFPWELNTLPSKQAESGEKSWKNLFKVWTRDEFCLFCAIIFVMLRSFLYVQPKIVATIKHYRLLKGMPSMALVCSPICRPVKRMKRRALVAERNPGKCVKKDDRETGKGVLSVSSWPSSSLAAVALAECNSRGVATEDANKRAVNGS